MNASVRGWRYHAERDRLLAEAHARPYTALAAPMLATRIATLSGEGGAAADRAHMTAVCRRLGHGEPGPDARWCALDAGQWRLRWERHTEFSTWTFFRAPATETLFAETALDLAPADWVAALPGDVLVAVNLEVRGRDTARAEHLLGPEASGARIQHDAASAFSDFEPDAGGMTRFLLLAGRAEPERTGRIARSLLEIETYRLMALLAFPLAGEATTLLTGIEARAAALAGELVGKADADEDRRLLGELAHLAGEAEALNARTSFRFGAARAYHEIVRDRIQGLRETPIEGMQTLGEFMERRLAPAMRTCDTVAARERDVIERIARTEQMLNTRVEVAAEATSASLLASMDRRADLQLRLQGAVEGLSVVAISYYAIGILFYLMQALGHELGSLDPKTATGLLAPAVIAAVWIALRRARARLDAHPAAPAAKVPPQTG